MIELTLDIFAGRKNPSWVMADGPALDILRRIAADLGFVTSPDAVPPMLGYRGISLRLHSLDLRRQLHLPQWLCLIPKAGLNLARHLAQAAELLWLVVRFGVSTVGMIASEVRRLVDRLFADLRGSGSTTGTPPHAGGLSAHCPFEMLPYDPAFWNDPAHIRRNNCYAYASNKRTDTFPQPGKASGNLIGENSCTAAVAAAKSDGMHDVTDCFGDSERPRLLVALVIWPGVDYHWYRKHPDFWGHKPGQTPARNYDSSNHVITDPQTCDRGPYTDFCGYFLLPNSLRVA